MRVSGPNSRALGERLFQSHTPLAHRSATYGSVCDDRGETIDRGIAIFCSAPHSYTGEDTLELQLHGSPVVVREVLRALLDCGARLAEPGEFTRRAFLNGKIDLRGAAAVADLIAAQTRAAARAANANLTGALTSRLREIRAQLQADLEEIAASTDFPDEVAEPDASVLRERLRAIDAQLAGLQRDGELGRLLREGVPVAIVGAPNAGKSSLLNALLGEDRALVSDIPGTTRDTIEESIAVRGVPFRLIDTAGIRAGAQSLEAAGIARTQRALERSQIALVVIDGSRAPDAAAHDVLERTRDRARVVFANKADIGDAGARALSALVDVTGSVRDHETLEALRATLFARVWSGSEPVLDRPHLATAAELDAASRARRALSRAQESLDRGFPADLCTADLREAFAALGHMSGDEAGEELLSAIFSRFCIGK